MSKRALVPEIRLVTACCRWPPSPARDEAVREAAAAITDWPRFLRVVRRHRVTGFVRASLSAAGVRLAVPAAFQLGRRADHLFDDLADLLLKPERRGTVIFPRSRAI